VSHQRSPRALCGIAALLLSLACGQGSDSTLAGPFVALGKGDEARSALSDSRRAAALGADYEQAFAFARAPGQRESVGAADLELLFRAAEMTAFQTLERRHVQDMRDGLRELERRGTATRRHYLHLRATLIKARMLDEARELGLAHPELALEDLPEFRDAEGQIEGAPTEWVVAGDRPTLLRRSVDLRQGAQIVVVSHPACHFSRAAARAIEADPTLRSVFAARSHWLAPQDGDFDIEVIQRWNREHPIATTRLTVQREEWPMIDSWRTPTFYVLEHSEPIAKIEGWPSAGRRAELLAALRRVGLP
jgi:hypothetical protein